MHLNLSLYLVFQTLNLVFNRFKVCLSRWSRAFYSNKKRLFCFTSASSSHE
jgi:hypothetical protein